MLEKTKIKEFIEDWLLKMDHPDLDEALSMLGKIDTEQFAEVLKYFIGKGCMDLAKFFEREEVIKTQLNRLGEYRDLLEISNLRIGKIIGYPKKDYLYFGIKENKFQGQIKNALKDFFEDSLFSYDNDFELMLLGITEVTSKDILMTKLALHVYQEDSHVQKNSVKTEKQGKEKEPKQGAVHTEIPVAVSATTRGVSLTAPAKPEYFEHLTQLVTELQVSTKEFCRMLGVSDRFSVPSGRFLHRFPVQKMYEFSGHSMFLDVVIPKDDAGKMYKAFKEGRVLPPPPGRESDPLDESTWITKENHENILVTKKLQEYIQQLSPEYISETFDISLSALKRYVQTEYLAKLYLPTVQKFYDFTGDESFLVAGVFKTPDAGKHYERYLQEAQKSLKKIEEKAQRKEEMKQETQEKSPSKAPPKIVTQVPPVEATPVVAGTEEMLIYEKLKAHVKHPEANELYKARKDVIAKQRERIVPKQSLQEFAEKAKIDGGELQVAYMTPIFNSQEMNKKLEKATGHTIFSIEEDRKLLKSIEAKVEQILETITPEAPLPLEVEEEVYEVTLSEKGEENAPLLDVPAEPIEQLEQKNEESIPSLEITEIVKSEETSPQESDVLPVEKSEISQVHEESVSEKIVLSEREKVEAHICFLEKELALVEDKMKEISKLHNDLLETIERLGSGVSVVFKEQMDVELHRLDQEIHALEEIFHKYTFQKEYAQNERALHHALEDAQLQIQKLKEELDVLQKTGGGVKEFVQVVNIGEIPKEYLSMYDYQSMRKVLEMKLATKSDIKKMAKVVVQMIEFADNVLYKMLPHLGNDEALRLECFRLMNRSAQGLYKNWNQFISVGASDDLINKDQKAQEIFYNLK